MRMHKGRRLAFGLGLLVVATIAGTAIFARGAIIERWYIHRLHSEDEATRMAAARKLADMKSLAAVPHLIRTIDADPRERAGIIIYEFGPSNYGYRLTPLSYALYRIGTDVPDPEKEMLMENLGLQVVNHERFQAIMECWHDSSDEVSEVPYKAIPTPWPCTGKPAR